MTGDRPAVALLGCGHWGQNLARNLANLGVLRIVCDANQGALDQVQKTFPEVRTTTTAKDVFDDPTITACVIATPAASHAALACEALEAGKDVFVEKPLALTAAEGEAVVTMAERGNRILMVGHLLEYHPAVEELRRLVEAGELGKIYYIYANRLNLGRIRTEENALWSFAPHDIHVILRLLGEEPVSVTCQGGSYLNEQIADVTMSTLEFASGVRGHIFVSWLHPYKDHRLVVVGDRKMAVFDDVEQSTKLRLYPHRIDWVERIPKSVKADAEEVALPNLEPLEAECRHFIECVTQRTRPRTDGANGVAVLRVLERCQESLEQGSGEERAARPSHALEAHHPTAVIDPGCTIGEGTRVWHYSHVMSGARIGRGCSLGQNVFVARTAVIGDNVKIQNNVSVYDGVILENDVFCGPSMVFTNVVNPRSHVSRKDEYKSTLVQQGATIGANVTVVCGHTVGRYAFIGAGAVVTRSVPDYALQSGVPARIKGWMCQCGVRLPLKVDDAEETCVCNACKVSYERKGQQVVALGSTNGFME